MSLRRILMLLLYICTEDVFLFIGTQIDPGQQTATYAHIGTPTLSELLRCSTISEEAFTGRCFPRPCCSTRRNSCEHKHLLTTEDRRSDFAESLEFGL